MFHKRLAECWNSIPLQFNRAEALQNTALVEWMSWNVHVLAMCKPSDPLVDQIGIDTVGALTNSDVHIISARPIVLCQAYVRQYAVQQLQKCIQAGLDSAANLAVISKTLMNA